MKIGVDARALTRSLTGIGRYTLEMCKVLSTLPDVELHLYSPSPIHAHFKDQNGIRKKASACHSSLARQLWSETVLPAWVKQDKPDVFWGPAHCLPRYLPKDVARVVTIHDLVWKYAADTMRPVTRWLEKFHMPFAVTTADKIVADSTATANAVKTEFGIEESRVEVVTLGATSLESLRNDALLAQFNLGKNYFLFVGTLEPRKNLDRLLTAYAALPQETKNQAMLLIAGGQGWGNLALEKRIEQLNIKQHVRLIGYINESILATLYANALFLAMPSLYEGFGLPLVEAMRFGTPVLTSNTSSMPEVSGSAGLLVNPLDTQSIQDGLRQLIENDVLRKQLASEAKPSAARFNWTLSGAKLLQVFHEAINCRNALI
ncbi:MAG: glycosyltransferase family 1 protein [Tatlockia sp.]|jgi:glycosyltransferase involved in cell wall biosynthesis